MIDWSIGTSLHRHHLHPSSMASLLVPSASSVMGSGTGVVFASSTSFGCAGLTPSPVLPLHDRCSGRGIFGPKTLQPRRCSLVMAAIADKLDSQSYYDSSSAAVLLDEDVEPGVKTEHYNWEEEWYPLYLAKEMPRDAPLGLTVFHKQLVLHYDGNGTLHCYEDCCPHRLAKLSEGQIIDGRLECLYHGWQFEGDGQCVKIPQLPAGAKIPKAACVRSYLVKESQGVIWVWMSEKGKADYTKIPHFEQFDDPTIIDFSTIHVLPYDHSILLENLMDPAHVPISHDRTDRSAKRENAQALRFEIEERTGRGFKGRWGEASSGKLSFESRFDAPCVFRNESRTVDKEGNERSSIAIFMCRPAGQGQSMLIVRFGLLSKKKGSALLSWFPQWIAHQVSNHVFEQDMGFLASQNEVLMRKGVGTSRLYINLSSSDVFVMEYRKWLDRVGHGMPYYVGHKTAALPATPAVVEAAPAGLVAAAAIAQPAKGGLGTPFAPNPINRYFRHVVHCSDCRNALKTLQSVRTASVAVILALASALILIRPVNIVSPHLQIAAVLVTLLAAVAALCSHLGIQWLTTNQMRPHRK